MTVQLNKDAVAVGSAAGNGAPGSAPERSYSSLNPQYPRSWWTIGFSEEVPQGRAVPNKVLEKDIVLWRSASGELFCHSAMCPHLGAHLGYGGVVVDDALKCPFHGFEYGAGGDVVRRPPPGGDAPTQRCRLTCYRVEEQMGTIFLWNGADEPDHPVPDLASEMLAANPGWRREDLVVFHHGFYFPYPAKWFLENGPDAAHFAFMHSMSEWGEGEILEETDTTLRFRSHLHDVIPYLSWDRLSQQYRAGELTSLQFTSGDIDITLHGGGLQVVRMLERVDAGDGLMARLLSFSESAQAVFCWLPTSAEHHVFRLTFVMRPVPVPIVGRAVEWLVGKLLEQRNWGGLMQDTAVMLHRQEPANPSYSRIDSPLMKFRRFWDRRIDDRSMWAGDNLRSNGLRAGIKWRDAPARNSGLAAHQ